MDEEIAKKLLDELGKHRSIVRPNNQLFLDILLSTDVSESSRFHEALPDRQQRVEENGFYYSLSLRRILRNKNAQNYQPLLWKKAGGSIASALGFYSSDALSRNLRANKDLVKMMMECQEPFSLLGKFQTYDDENPEGILFAATRPILIIPDSKDMQQIYDWEEKNTTYEKEVGFLLRHSKRIGREEYLAH
ncbi:MAG: hypothetical protein AABY05_02430 [Nanoarchaeota archaeon]